MKTPTPFSFNKKQVKAFILGADPANYSKNNERVEIHFAFGIGEDARYFKDILANLNLIGLHLEDLYIQNLLSDYQDNETGKNKDFFRNAQMNAVKVTAAFNMFNP